MDPGAAIPQSLREGAIPIELHGAPGAKRVRRLDCTASIRDANGLTRRYETFLNYES